MTEPEPPTSSENIAPAMSLGGRLANIFVAPSDVFDEVKASAPQMANWIAPLVAAIIVGIIYSLIVFSQPTVMQGMREPAEKKIQQMVDSGKIQRAQADQSEAMIEKIYSPMVFRVVGIVLVLFFDLVTLFLAALMMWVLGKFLCGGNFTYGKSMEATGLALTVLVPGTLVAMSLAVIFGSLYMTPGPVLLVSHFDINNQLHMFLSALDLVWIWFTVVWSIGLSRLSGAGLAKSMLCGFACWVVFKLGPVFLGILVAKLSQGGK